MMLSGRQNGNEMKMKMHKERHDGSGGNDVIYSYDIFVHLYDISVCYISIIYDIFI